MKKNSNVLKYAVRNVREAKKSFSNTVYFKVLKVIFYIVGAYSLLVSLAMLLGCVLGMDEYSSKANTDEVALYNQLRVRMWSMIIAIATTVATFILLRLKQAVPVAVLGLSNCLISFTVFYSASVKNDIINGGQMLFWSAFGVPSIVFAVLSIAVGTLLFIERKRVISAYNTLASEIYNTYSEDGNKPLNPEEYEKIMNSYNGEELFRTDIPLKKSQRRRKQKQNSETAKPLSETVDNEER